MGLALGGYALGGRPAVAGADSAVAGANSAVGAAASIKDLMQAAEKEREAKKAAQVSIRQHTSAYVGQHTSAYVSIRQHTRQRRSARLRRRRRSAYVSIRQHT